MTKIANGTYTRKPEPPVTNSRTTAWALAGAATRRIYSETRHLVSYIFLSKSNASSYATLYV